MAQLPNDLCVSDASIVAGQDALALARPLREVLSPSGRALGALCLGLMLSVSLSLDAFAQSRSGAPKRPEPTTQSTPSSDPARRIAFLHIPPKPDDIPYPGQPFTISVGLSNTRETRAPMRVALSKDGRFMELAAKEAYLDKRDRPIYEFTVPAPIAEMTYQMFVVQSDGDILTSPRFAVRRTCIPNIGLALGQVAGDVQGVERLRKLVDESKSLDNDLQGYQEVLRLLGQLKEVIG